MKLFFVILHDGGGVSSLYVLYIQYNNKQVFISTTQAQFQLTLCPLKDRNGQFEEKMSTKRKNIY